MRAMKDLEKNKALPNISITDLSHDHACWNKRRRHRPVPSIRTITYVLVASGISFQSATLLMGYDEDAYKWMQRARARQLPDHHEIDKSSGQTICTTKGRPVGVAHREVCHDLDQRVTW